MNDKLAKYEYNPKNPKKLKLKAVLHKLRDYRLLFIFSIPLYIMWGCFAAACVALPFIYEFKTDKDYTDMATSYVALIVSGLVLFGIYMLIFAVKKLTDTKAAVANTKKYLQISDSFIEEVENDLAKGMPFLKSHNLGISENYIFGNLTLINFTPVIIPKSEIVEVIYEIFEGASTLVAHNGHVTNARNFYQNFFFRLKNGNYVPVQVNDKFKLDIALAALQKAGLKTVELNRNATGNEFKSKNTRNIYKLESERIIVRNLDVTKIIPLPVTDSCIRFDEISYGTDGNLCATAVCKDDGKMRYFIDERIVAITAKQVIAAPQPKPVETPKEALEIMLKVKNREYKTIKWEKRKDQILAYEKMYKAQVEELKKSLNSEVSSNAKQWCLLELSYASIVELDYINKREEAFKEHLKDLLQNASLCCKAYNDGVDMHEATRRPIAEGLKSGYEGYYALIAQDEDVLMNVTNEEHPLRKLLEHKKIPTETDKYDELCDMINAIVENDSDAFNEALSARIRSIRKMPTDYFICLDVWSMGLIRYAEKQGMIVDRDKYIETDLSSIGL